MLAKRTLPIAEHDPPQLFAALDADDEPDQVGRHEQQDVGDASCGCEVAIPGF